MRGDATQYPAASYVLQSRKGATTSPPREPLTPLTLAASWNATNQAHNEMKEQDLSQYETALYASGSLPRPKAFSFSDASIRIDWRAVAGVDLDQMVGCTDIDQLERVVHIVAHGDIQAENTRQLTETNFVKIFRLAQLAIQYLLHVQDVLSSERSELLKTDANIKAHSHETLLRTKDYKNLVKQQERDIRRLRRQLHTYEALATTQREAAAAQSQTLQEATCVTTDTEIKAVTQETMKKLWDQDQASRSQVSELQSELASAKERNKELERRLEERDQEAETVGSVWEQLQDARDKVQHMLVVYERAVAERDDFSKQARSANMNLSQQRLLMAHAQRQLDRARRENLKLRSDVKDLSGGRKIERWTDWDDWDYQKTAAVQELTKAHTDIEQLHQDQALLEGKVSRLAHAIRSLGHDPTDVLAGVSPAYMRSRHPDSPTLAATLNATWLSPQHNTTTVLAERNFMGASATGARSRGTGAASTGGARSATNHGATSGTGKAQGQTLQQLVPETVKRMSEHQGGMQLHPEIEESVPSSSNADQSLSTTRETISQRADRLSSLNSSEIPDPVEQVEGWWKEVGEDVSEPTEPDPSVCNPERLASAGRSLPIQHNAASIKSVHSKSQLASAQHANPFVAEPSRLHEEPCQSVSLAGRCTDDVQATTSDPPVMQPADTALINQPSGQPAEDAGASGTLPEGVRQETLFSMTLGQSDVGEPATLRRGSSEMMDYVPIPPIPGSPIPPMPEPFEESEPQLDLPRPKIFGSNGGENEVAENGHKEMVRCSYAAARVQRQQILRKFEELPPRVTQTAVLKTLLPHCVAAHTTGGAQGNGYFQAVQYALTRKPMTKEEFVEIEKGPLLKARRFISYQIEKRIRVLKASTGNSDADIGHLTDHEYVELMTKHNENLEKHIRAQLVEKGPIERPTTASKMHAHLKLELLLHSHNHTDILLKVAKAAGAANRQWRTTSGVSGDGKVENSGANSGTDRQSAQLDKGARKGAQGSGAHRRTRSAPDFKSMAKTQGAQASDTFQGFDSARSASASPLPGMRKNTHKWQAFRTQSIAQTLALMDQDGHFSRPISKAKEGESQTGLAPKVNFGDLDSSPSHLLPEKPDTHKFNEQTGTQESPPLEQPDSRDSAVAVETCNLLPPPDPSTSAILDRPSTEPKSKGTVNIGASEGFMRAWPSDPKQGASEAPNSDHSNAEDAEYQPEDSFAASHQPEQASAAVNQPQTSIGSEAEVLELAHGDRKALGEALSPGASVSKQQAPLEDPTGSSSKSSGLRNVLRSSDTALASRAYACAPSQSAAGHSNNTSTSGSGSVLVHSQGSSVMDAPAAPEAHSQAPATSASETEYSEGIQGGSKHSNLALRSALMDGQSAASTSASEGTRTAPKVRQDEDGIWLSSNRQRLDTQAPAAPSSTSSFPLKLAEVTEADRLEMRNQAVLPKQSAVVSRVLGRLGGSVLSQTSEGTPKGFASAAAKKTPVTSLRGVMAFSDDEDSD